jgi:hypothetical protein
MLSWLNLSCPLMRSSDESNDLEKIELDSERFARSTPLKSYVEEGEHVLYEWDVQWQELNLLFSASLYKVIARIEYLLIADLDARSHSHPVQSEQSLCICWVIRA